MRETMSEETFKVGDIVYLGSGSPELIVIHIREDGKVNVVWFDDTKTKQELTLPPACLTYEKRVMYA